jgi:hypothetical protein
VLEELLEELDELELDCCRLTCGRTSITLLLPVAASRAVPISFVPVAAILPEAAAYTFAPAVIAPDATIFDEPP